ncbi:hypothetical protein B0H66DRAFT_479034 [Apodospora peruviana]|uniref:NACHT domain-containing protein n=1 Tax=Apodospora peruviana TaxID=516989 RepID=A0AAE0HZH4_9PEZI|nr:hypothetical protein B0H66DRAFT_479034 [Apodospora peruviana]
MDPFSISLSIAGVLPLVATVIRLARKYHEDVKGARESISLLITELGLLESAITSLDAFLESDDGKDAVKDLHLDQSSALRTCCAACSAKLKVLAAKLGNEIELAKGPAGRARYLLWPLSEREHKKTIQELRNLTLWIQFSLSVDNMRIVCRSSDQMATVMRQQLEQLQCLSKAQETVEEMRLAVEGHTSRLDAQREFEYRRKVLDWISPPGHDQRHHAIQALRLGNTGNWLLRRPEFLAWSSPTDGHESPNVLWCYGGPGTGKTVLVSVVIDHLLELSLPATVVGFLYVDYKSQTRQSALAMLLSLLRQLAEATSSLPKCVQTAFDAQQQVQRHLSMEDAQQLLSAIVSESSKTSYYIIIDALDECASSQRRAFLEGLSELVTNKRVHLLITGRPHVRDVERYFAGCGKFAISADEEDLRRYIRHELDFHGTQDLIDDEFAYEIVEQLIAASRGMFLLAVLHLRTLVDLTSVGAIQDVLGSLSESLSEAYRTTVARIQHQTGNRAELGMQVLRWVCFAARPLTVEELQDVLCIKAGQTRRDARYRPVLRIVLECCQGLILVDPDTSLVRPAHYTVQEHMVENAGTLFPQHSHDLLAQKCLTYLTLDDFTQGPEENMARIAVLVKSYPFLSYAACYWHAHLSPLGVPKEAELPLWKFLGSAELRATAKQVSAFSNRFVWRYCQPQECLSQTALHMACLAGLTSVVAQLLNGDNPHTEDNINTRSHIGTTPIIQAAAGGYVDILRLLLDHGADPYIENAYGNALHCAVEAGESNAISVLVQHAGMSPGWDSRYSRLPIRCVLDRDSADAFETLLELGASIAEPEGTDNKNEIEYKFESLGSRLQGVLAAVDFLHLAVEYDAGNIIRVIARRKLLNINATNKLGSSPLHISRRNGCVRAARALEEVGAKEISATI